MPQGQIRGNRQKEKWMEKSITLYVFILLVLLSMGCSSSKVELPLETTPLDTEIDINLSADEAKRMVLDAERDIKILKEQEGDGDAVFIGNFGVSPVYGLELSNRNQLESKLSKYFSQELMKYFLMTHEIVCTEKECGNYGDSEGQYIVDTEGNFEMIEQTEQYSVLQVPFTFKGINENGEFRDTNGTYTFTKYDDGYLITAISQEYNDNLYNYDSDLLVIPEEEFNTIQDIEDDLTRRN